MGKRWTTQELALPDDEPEDDAPVERRLLGGRKLTAVLLIIAAVLVAFAVLRFSGVEGHVLLVAALAMTPFVPIGAGVLALVSLVLRRRIAAIAAALVALSLGAILLPRMSAADQPQAGGPRLRIMTVTLDGDVADARALRDLVSHNKVDVLALPGLSPASVSSLDHAGLAEVLPYRVFDPRPNGNGSGIAATIPLRQIVLQDPTVPAQPGVVVDLLGQRDAELLAVNMFSAVEAGSVPAWHQKLDALPKPGERPRILAGDFNATLDQPGFRTLLDRGYHDAADQTGSGLSATWSSIPFGLPAARDHVLADSRCAITTFETFEVPSNDHRAVLVGLTLP